MATRAPSRRAARTTAPKRRSAKQDREDPESLEANIPEIEIADLETFSESTNILLYGPAGHGKTVLAGGARRATYMSTEKGVVAARRVGHTAKLMRTPTWEHCLAAMNMADKQLGPEDWLICDSGTKMQIMYYRWILKTIKESKPNRDLDIAAIQDHQKWQKGFQRFVDHMIDAPYNLIMVATPMTREDEDGDDAVIPHFEGKGRTISDYISAQFDVVLYYAVSKIASDKAGETIRRALAQPHPDLPYIAKDRFQALGEYWEVGPGNYWAMAEMIEAIDESMETDAA